MKCVINPLNQVQSKNNAGKNNQKFPKFLCEDIEFLDSVFFLLLLNLDLPFNLVLRDLKKKNQFQTLESISFCAIQ